MANTPGAQPIPSVNYTILLPFDPNNPDLNGGDSRTQDLNLYYQSGDIAWMLTATALVLLMIPGVG
jgi:ammonium transporter, Amt family